MDSHFYLSSYTNEVATIFILTFHKNKQAHPIRLFDISQSAIILM